MPDGGTKGLELIPQAGIDWSTPRLRVGLSPPRISDAPKSDTVEFFEVIECANQANDIMYNEVMDIIPNKLLENDKHSLYKEALEARDKMSSGEFSVENAYRICYDLLGQMYEYRSVMGNIIGKKTYSDSI